LVSLLATVPIAILMSHQIFEQFDVQRQRMREEMQRSAAVLAQAVNRELTSSIDALTILSYSDEVQQGQIASFERALLARPLLRPSWSGIYLTSLNGEKLFDTARRPPRSTEAQAAGAPPIPIGATRSTISKLHYDREEDSFVTTIEVPVIIGGAARYILGARIRASLWQQLVDNSGITAPGVAAIFDNDHRIIARNLSPNQTVGTQITAANQALIDGRRSGSAQLTLFEGGSSYSAWDTVPLSQWGVSIGVPAAPFEAVQKRATIAALATAAACLMLGIVLALWVARRMTRPLRQLSHNDFSQPMERIAVREISLLRDALLAARLHDEAVRELVRSKRDLLEKKADEFEALFSACPVGLAFSADRECRSVLHNAAMDALFGNASKTGGGVTVLRAGRPLPRTEQPLYRAAACGETTSGLELEILIGANPSTFVIVTAVPLLDAEGKPRGAIGGAVDITERKAAEARLIDAERRLRESQRLIDLAQESSQVGFIRYMVESETIAWTPGQAKLFAFTEDMGLDRIDAWRARVGPTDWRRIERRMKVAVARRHETETLSYCIDLPDGSTRWLSSRVRLIYSPDGALQQIVAITVDVTEEKHAERERAALTVREQAARREAEAANRSKDEFLAMLGHELRNPLSAIASGIDVLDRVSGEAETARNARRIIRRQTRHLAHMMEDLLDVARVISGNVVMARQPVELAALVRRVMATLSITNEADNHELQPDLHEVWIDADATRIEQVVANLIGNAIKYTPAGGRIEIGVSADDGEACLQVRDNGSGIAPELLPRVFDLFVQGERPLDRRVGGLGVGLTLTRRIVELHGGTVCAANADPGTVMIVRLPAIEKPPVLLPMRTVSELRQRRVAIVDDNDDVLEALRAVLELDGQHVRTASDGVRGLALILETRPDVAVVDLGLPGLTGFEVATRSRAGGYAGRMIALSGYGQQGDVERALVAGFDAHFLKPVDARELLVAIASD
jgi:PAS domain S-box-containing protein